MSPTTRTVTISLLGLALCPWLAACTRGSGVHATETRSTPGFTAIDVGNAIALEVEVGPATRVEVEGDDNVVPKVRTEVEGDTLRLALPGSVVTSLPLTVHVTTPALHELDASGASTVDVRGLTGERLDVELDGASTARLQGELGALDADVSGASTLRAAELAARAVDVEAGGASTAEVHATESLDADASGASTVRYHGQPATLHRNASGASKVEPAS
ncbi:MAG: DUF2807 domain-containing protein [Myxococcales bacterium]|nr:DUF2807 domain-containing protein [Myxococcales bacterium]